MELDPAELAPRENYRLLTSVVVPRPIAWVSSLDADGVRNLAPHSYFNVISSDPPIVHFTSTGVKDSLRNVEATGEFVTNIVDQALVEPMNRTSAPLPPGEDEFAWAGLEPAPSVRVAPPRVARAKVALECRRRATLAMGNGHMVFGEVVWAHVDDSVWDGGAADPSLLEPVARLGGTAYGVLADVFHLQRPTAEEVARDGAR